VVLVWILISAYGSQIAMGVGEEKQNRIVEVILASVRPIQLLVGKVTGIGILALAQAALMVAVFLGLGAAVGSSLVHGAAPGIVITGAVFLVLGYAFYCTAYAAAGSLVSRQSDVGAVILPVQVPLIIAYALSYTVIYADGANVFYRVLAGAAAALVPGGTLLVVGHDLTNLTEGVGGPTSPDVLYTPEVITAGLPGLRILRAERVHRTVEREGGQATAIDTLVRAERPAI